MAQDPPEFTNWQEAWEWHASQTAQSYADLPVADLLARIRGGHYDHYYTIWSSLARRATLAEAAPVLLEVLRREHESFMDLIRYHCAGALFALMGYPDDDISPLRARVQWQHSGEPARQEAIDELELEIADILGRES